MTPTISKEQVKKYVGKTVYAVKKDGTIVTGKLIRIKGQELQLQPANRNKVQTKAVLPLVLFDLLAIGTAPYAYGAYGGYPYSGGFYGGGLYGGGFPGLFW